MEKETLRMSEGGRFHELAVSITSPVLNSQEAPYFQVLFRMRRTTVICAEQVSANVPLSAREKLSQYLQYITTLNLSLPLMINHPPPTAPGQAPTQTPTRNPANRGSAQDVWYPWAGHGCCARA